MESRAKPFQQQSQVLCYVTIAVFAVLNEPWSSSLKVQEFDNWLFFFLCHWIDWYLIVVPLNLLMEKKMWQFWWLVGWARVIRLVGWHGAMPWSRAMGVPARFWEPWSPRGTHPGVRGHGDRGAAVCFVSRIMTCGKKQVGFGRIFFWECGVIISMWFLMLGGLGCWKSTRWLPVGRRSWLMLLILRVVPLTLWIGLGWSN